MSSCFGEVMLSHTWYGICGSRECAFGHESRCFACSRSDREERLVSSQESKKCVTLGKNADTQGNLLVKTRWASSARAILYCVLLMERAGSDCHCLRQSIEFRHVGRGGNIHVMAGSSTAEF